jgi:predicted GNAT superfamily acetyltransferase
LGRQMKLHQRAWAAEQGLGWITWTFDPLVRRNAWFNIAVLGAQIDEYLVDFYGQMDDSINGSDPSDRLLVAWSTAGPPPDHLATPAVPPGAIAVPTPEDIIVLRRTDATEASSWRLRVREELGTHLATGGRVVGFTRNGEYLVLPAPTE